MKYLVYIWLMKFTWGQELRSRSLWHEEIYVSCEVGPLCEDGTDEAECLFRLKSSPER
jgi:hypothetical protein